jgi:hypothetical protein
MMGYHGLTRKNPRKDLEKSLEDSFAKIISMHDGADDVMGLIPAARPSQQVSTYFVHFSWKDPC